MHAWKIFIFSILSAWLALTGPVAEAAPALNVGSIQTKVNHEFGQHITFQVDLESTVPIEKAYLVFEDVSQTYTSLGEMQIGAPVDGVYELQYRHKIEDYHLRAFAIIEYHVEVRLQGGEMYTSPVQQYQYSDNRFEWQPPRREGPFEVRWYEGDEAFAQSVLDIAQEGLLRIENMLQTSQPAPITLYVYASGRHLQEALHPSSESWVAGHADPDLGVILVALPPGPDQRLLIEQRIPHELAHIILYQTTLLGYKNLPIWFTEGIASLAELYPSPDYQIVLDSAVENNNLIPLPALCDSFPRDASGALLAYAQSASFTQYLRSAYGISGLQALMKAYANGLSCDQGAKIALGASLTQLERQWQRQELSTNIALTALTNLLPWLLVLLGALAAPLFLILRKPKA
jgi:hypothetical protein